jgi:hypothetical protein
VVTKTIEKERRGSKGYWARRRGEGKVGSGQEKGRGSGPPVAGVGPNKEEKGRGKRARERGKPGRGLLFSFKNVFLLSFQNYFAN